MRNILVPISIFISFVVTVYLPLTLFKSAFEGPLNVPTTICVLFSSTRFPSLNRIRIILSEITSMRIIPSLLKRFSTSLTESTPFRSSRVDRYSNWSVALKNSEYPSCLTNCILLTVFRTTSFDSKSLVIILLCVFFIILRFFCFCFKIFILIIIQKNKLVNCFFIIKYQALASL